MMKWSMSDMKAATELTTKGKLSEATAAIQKLLGGHRKPTVKPTAPAWQPKRLPTAEVSKPTARKVSPAKPRKSTPNAQTGRFETGSFSSVEGQRSYKLYTPGSYVGQAMPLIVMLHGCTQTPDDFAAGTQMNALAEEFGFLVAYPAQPKSANSMGCWNWFNTADQQKDQGEPALIAGIVGQIVADRAVDQARIYVAGLSAGGAMAAVLGMTYPEMFAAIGVHSGLPCGAASDVMTAFGAMKNGGKRTTSRGSTALVPTIVFHGDKDQTVHPVNSDNVIAQFDPAATFARSATVTGTSPGRMRYSHSTLATADGVPVIEQWVVHGAGHAWSGGSAQGSYTEPKGPDASREMVRFFLAQSKVA